MSQQRIHPRLSKLGWRCLAPVCLALALSGAAVVPSAAVAATSSQAPPAGPHAAVLPEPISAVVLADESGSETAASITAEQNAAAALVESDPSAGSQFMIAGFGSQNRPGQQAVTPYCNFIATSSPTARESLAVCAHRIRARSEAQGWDTDQAQALEFAIEQLRGRPGLKVIFLLTDGVLDVHNSPIYGRVPSQRTPEAWRIIEQQILPGARADGIQVWPLGFGPEASYASLEPFAVGGSGVDARCGSSAASQPRAIVVSDLFDVVYKLVSDQTAARCGSVGTPNGGDLGPGGSIDLHVRIPAIASYGALTVVTGSPQVRAAFVAPNGVEVPGNGSVDGQTLHESGAGTDVQTMRIVSPVPGVWTVRLTAPAGLVEHTRVVAFASWQGVLSASLFVSPVQAIPGQPVSIELRVLSRNGVVVGPALSSLAASAVISGPFGRVVVPLRLAGDTAFRGAATLPKGASGDVLVSAQISGAGIAGDQASETLVTQSSDFLAASFAVELPPSIHPGSVLRGEVTTINQGPSTRGALRLEGFSPGALVTIAGGAIAIPSGTSRAPFAIRISPAMKLGPAFVSVVLDGEGDKAIAASPMDIQVVAPPSWWTRSRGWAIPLGILLLVLAGASGARARLRAARHSRAVDTRGLTATLLVDGTPAHPPLTSDGGEVFPLALTADDWPQLVHADVASGAGTPIAIRRTDQSASIATGESEARECRFGEPVPVGPGIALQIDSPDPEDIHHHERAAGAAPEAHDITTDESVPVAGRWR